MARELEGNWTRFTPHYIVWVCPESYRASDECQSQCIHNGRYCTPDPDGDLLAGYSGKDIVQVRILFAPFLTIFIFASFNARWALQHGGNANLNCLHATFCLIFCSCNQFFCLNLMTKGKLWIELQKCQSNAHATSCFLSLGSGSW